MNVAKNKKSAFQNLFEVLSNLNEEELKQFSLFLKSKRKETKNDKFLSRILSLIQDNETVETIDEREIKHETESNLSPNFNKLTENLYHRLLVFLSDNYKKSQWKAWQIESENTLTGIEALCDRRLYQQATAELLKLEERLLKHEKFTNLFHDTTGVYSKLVNLKFNLARFDNNGFIKTNQTDRLIQDLLMFGYYYEMNQRETPKPDDLKKHKYIGYQLLAKFFEEQENYQDAKDAINVVIESIEANYKDSDPIVVEHIQNYFRLVELFLDAKLNNRVEYRYKSERITSVESTMLQEELIISLLNSTKPFEELYNHNAEFYVDLLFYSETQIEHLPDRLEVNRAILFYIQNKVENSLEIVTTLKSYKRNKQRAKEIFIDISLLELLCRIKKNETDLTSLFRNIKTLLKEYKNKIFENKAIKLLEISPYWLPHQKKYFLENESKNIDELEGLVKKTKPIHRLILMTLKNEL